MGNFRREAPIESRSLLSAGVRSAAAWRLRHSKRDASSDSRVPYPGIGRIAPADRSTARSLFPSEHDLDGAGARPSKALLRLQKKIQLSEIHLVRRGYSKDLRDLYATFAFI